MSKRARTGSYIDPRTQFDSPYSNQMTTKKADIDKQIINVTKSGLTNTQQFTNLYTCTYPCTVTGLRWDVNLYLQAGVAASCAWAIQVVKQGNSMNNISNSDGSSLLVPESNILVWGKNVLTGVLNVAHEVGDTKSMRKLQAGDVLQFCCVGETGTTTEVFGSIQYFLKS